MKLWLISQDENTGYDTYDAAVVAAETEDAARQTLPHYAKWERGGVWASSPEKVTAKFIGEAAESIEAGTILGSFNAG